MRKFISKNRKQRGQDWPKQKNWEVAMFRSISTYLIMGLLLVVGLSLAGCGSESGGTVDTPPLVKQSYNERCITCHSESSIASVTIVHSLQTKSLQGEITGVTIDDGAVTVAFKLFDSSNNLVPLGSVSASSIRFSIAKLVGEVAGNSSYWQSYINQIETKEAGGPGPMPDGNTALQATYERADTTGGVFTNNGDGTYSYQLSFDITDVTSPVVVTYDPSLTHRIAIQISDNIANPFVSFVPNDLPVMGTGPTRSIVANASCDECHVKLGFHGSDRIQVEYCVNCHNPGSGDAYSGNTVDLKVMAHKIHRGEDLPSVQAGGSYVIWGHNESKHDYSTVIYPQDIRNCIKCHDGSDSQTPDGDNWKTVPTMQACGSCHDDVDFATGENHSQYEIPQQDNSLCTVCHPATGTVDFGKSVTAAHEIPEQIAAENFQLNVLSVSTVEEIGGSLDVTIEFSVTNPNTGVPYDITDTTTVDLTGLGFLIGWPTTDYTNRNSGSNPAQPVRAGITGATDLGDNTYTLTVINAVPAGVKGSGVVGFQGHPNMDLDGDGQLDDRVPVRSVFKSFAITDTTAEDRRDVVSIAKCDQCHGTLSLHGMNRTDQIQVCVICHNPDATDINVRPANKSDAVDGKAEETIDLKYMIHAIHAGEKDKHGFREKGIVVYGYRGSVHDYSDVRFPGVLQDCAACHDRGTYYVPLGNEVLPTTVGTGANLADPDDDKNYTPTASVCASCHDTIDSKNHMAENGGEFNFVLYKPEEISTGGPSGTQPPGHTNRTDCSSCHG